MKHEQVGVATGAPVDGVTLSSGTEMAQYVAADLGIFLLAAATLLFEITLTRLFSVAQFYHFAFMIVSLAMLGFGASGTWLALLEERPPRSDSRRRSGGSILASPLLLTGLALAFGVTCLGGYAVLNWLPFDSFSIAWDRRQILLLCLHYAALAVPFFCSGAVLSLRFLMPGADDHQISSIGRIYGYNLTGSAMGCVLALVLPPVVGGVGAVWLSASLGGLAALALLPRRLARATWSTAAGAVALVIVGGVLLGVRPEIAALNLSPYKGLSYALQVPGAKTIWRGWNGYSRVDVVESSAIRSLPGLSYRFRMTPPEQQGLFVDGDDMSPVLSPTWEVTSNSSKDALAFAAYMPTAIAYQLRPEAHVLILEPRGGLEVWIALGALRQDPLTENASSALPYILTVTSNPLVVDAVGDYVLGPSDGASRVFSDSPVVTVVDDPRSFVRRHPSSDAAGERYDVVTLALTRPYRPIRSGAYSLGEDYHYTVEAFQDYLTQLAPSGFFVVSSWLQMPPSESLRTFALIVEALEARGMDPGAQIVAFRGYALMTFLVSERPFLSTEVATIREFAASRAFDLVYAPGIQPDWVNRYNILSSPIYYETFTALLDAGDSHSGVLASVEPVPTPRRRDVWYGTYPFDVRPPTDDHPFFGHFFKWAQAKQIVVELGKTWQPFGGAGYFVLLALLGLSLVAAVVLIGLPVLVSAPCIRPGDIREPNATFEDSSSGLAILPYFGVLGLGYLFVEIPLMQRAIRFLGHPAQAVTAVLFTLLFFSGLGSVISTRLRVRLPWALLALVSMIVIAAVGLPVAFDWLLPLPWGGRLAAMVVALAPLGTLMGLPFPLGLRYISRVAPRRVPWAWAANGAMSVVASMLSSLISLSVGFTWVFVLGAAAYGLAGLLALRWVRATGHLV